MPKRQRSEAPAPPAREELIEDDESDDFDSEEETAVAIATKVLPKPAKETISNVAGLRQALQGLVDPDLPWIERLEVVAAEDLPSIAPDDDLKLELAL